MRNYSMEEKILSTLRAQAWERAKGELHAVLQTYWDGYGADQKYREMDVAVRQFVATVEDNGLAE
jgi:hypothetical protein